MIGNGTSQADFAYPARSGSHAALPAGGLVAGPFHGFGELADAAAIALYSDRPHVLLQWREEALMAGFRVEQAAPLARIADGAPTAPAEVVLADCPAGNAAAIAALSRLDGQAHQAGGQLIVATSRDALEDVFSCLDQSTPQLLVDPSAVDLALALGRARAMLPGRSLRELADDDRMQLLRLTEQVGRLAARLGEPGFADGAGSHVSAPVIAFRGAPGPAERLAARPRAPLPDPALIRTILRHRQQRARFFPGDLFADPAWDMLLDLTAARAEHQRVSVTSLCIASGVPPTTALRWISQMTHAGLFERVEDTADRRRAFIALSDRAAEGMSAYFAAVGEAAAIAL